VGKYSSLGSEVLNFGRRQINVKRGEILEDEMVGLRELKKAERNNQNRRRRYVKCVKARQVNITGSRSREQRVINQRHKSRQRR